MRKSGKRSKSFKEMLEMYFQIKGLDIIVQLSDGKEIQLDKNRIIIDDMIVMVEKGKREKDPHFQYQVRRPLCRIMKP